MPKYTEEQTKIIESTDDQIRVIAGPGSGKSTSIVGRIVKLLERQIEPERIFVVCFAKHDKQNIISRLSLLVDPFVVSRIKINNYHGFGLNLIRQYGLYGIEGQKIKLLKESESRSLIRSLLLKLYVAEYKDEKKGEFILSLAKKCGIVDEIFGLFDNLRDEHCLDLKDISQRASEQKIAEFIATFVKRFNGDSVKHLADVKDEIRGFSGQQLIRVDDIVLLAGLYGQFCQQHGYVDFMDMILQPYLMLKRNPRILDSVSDNIHHMLVDEFQDISALQFELVSLLTQKYNRIFAVGDVDQCQPADTRISIPGGKTKRIDQIRVGDKVISLCAGSRCFNGVTNESSAVVRIGSRPFSGDLVYLSSEGNVSRSTPEHVWMAKLKDDSINYHVTYMTKKGHSFHVGSAPISPFAGCAPDLASATEAQHSDEVWILGVHNNENQAQKEANQISLSSGLPILRTHHNGKQVNTGIPGSAAEDSEDLAERACRLLGGFGRRIDCPLYRSRALNFLDTGGIHKFQACNLIPKIMLLPEFRGTEEIYWSEFTKSSKHSICKVFSLEIESDHTYVSDGIGTHNCVYEWRNAKPAFMKDELPRRYTNLVSYPLSINFRSDANIVRIAYNLISHNVDRMNFRMTPFHPATKDVTMRRVLSVFDQAEAIGNLISHILFIKSDYWTEKDHKIAIIVRSVRSTSSNLIRNALLKRGIPVKLRMPSKSTEQMMQFVSNLCNIIVDTKSPVDFVALASILPGFGEKSVTKIEQSIDRHGAIKDGLANVKLPQAKLELLDRLLSYVTEINLDLRTNPKSTLAELNLFGRQFKIHEYAREYFTQGKGFTENSEAIDATVEEVSNNIEDFHTYRDTLATGLTSLNSEADSGKLPSVLFTTAHGAKGGEWQTVICPDLIQGASGFPAGKDANSEEERRTFFVAITRAIKDLYLFTYSINAERKPVPCSPYIKEMGASKPTNPEGRPTTLLRRKA
jgi:superfamily I DNA/RNA helicase